MIRWDGVSFSLVCDLKKAWEVPGNERGEERGRQRKGQCETCGRRKCGSFMEARPLGLDHRHQGEG